MSIKGYEEIGSYLDTISRQEIERQDQLIDVLKDILPSKLKDKARNSIAREIAENIESTVEEAFREQYKNNLITYSSVLASSSRVRVDDYLNAVKFVTYRNSGLTVKDSYCLIKADEIQRDKLNNGLTDEQILNRANAFAQNKIVKDIQASNSVPLHIIYGDYVVDGIQRMHEIIMKGKDREAIGAFDVLARTVMPKDQIELSLDTSALDKKLEELQNAQANFANSIVADIKSGNMSIKDLLSRSNKRNSEVIEAELV